MALALGACGSDDPPEQDAGVSDAGPDGGGGDGGTPDGGAPDGGDGGTSDGGSDGGTGAARESGDGVSREATTVAGISVDRYAWMDSEGRERTVSLKRQSPGSNGGYAVQMTYQVRAGTQWRTVTLDGTGGGESGFGYFVAHELYRSFDNGTSGTIAALHGEDDSPLGLGFPVEEVRPALSASDTVVTHTVTLRYPKWGTRVAMSDVTATTQAAASAHQKFMVPVSIRWVFEKGMDFPRIDTRLDLSEATAGQVSFDVRGPYGPMEFADADPNATLNNVQWGDSLNHFSTGVAAAGALTTQANWTWNEPLAASRKYNVLLARHSSTGVLYELGLVELKLGTDAGLVYGGYSLNNGSTKAATGNALNSGGFSEGEWPFQSAQYSGLGTTPVTGKKVAWGSSPFYGSTFTTVYFNDTTSRPIVAYPANRSLVYRTCLVVGVSPYTDASRKSLTRLTAESQTPRCSSQQSL
ncbi:hypothetical protein LZ198_13670 [Myxococcus sp. K15C18031901]|uniref:hypothetical protein n=1 Tax=Myxococcus dinghuensis TaxID=2906761 RepID=UPI0020A8082D|nr:hypothetical protein [Myxococcus dinghuensis]MCP3099919.1 hypothetical protein [Myxococcus dinghuensis]